METSGAGSTILLLVAAALWLTYLVPLWMRRSEYYATVVNAARLGQTLRLLASTTEASKEIKAELKVLAIAKKEREAQRQLRIAHGDTLTVAERRRRTKQVFSLTCAAGAVAGITAFVAGWPIQVVWASGTVATFSLAILGRLNRVNQQSSHTQAQHPSYVPHLATSDPRAWTPTPLPEPRVAPSLQSETALPSRDQLLRQARSAAVAKRPEEFDDEDLAVVSLFARMGDMGARPTERLNLDEVLARRRAV